MEVLAIGLLGIAGKYITDRFNNNKEDMQIESDEEEYNDDEIQSQVNGFDQRKRVSDTMDEKVKLKTPNTSRRNESNVDLKFDPSIKIQKPIYA